MTTTSTTTSTPTVPATADSEADLLTSTRAAGPLVPDDAEERERPDPVIGAGAPRPGMGIAVWCGFAAGAAVLAAAYLVAAAEPYRIETRYLLFWIGLSLGLVPAVLRLLNPLVHRFERQCIVVGLALFTAVPKYLRNPGKPLFFDELAHWSQAEQLARNRTLFETNGLVKVIKFYPGLAEVTVALRHFTGLSTWHVALVLIFTAHVLTLLALYRIGLLLTRQPRLAGITAVAYALNPAFLIFNSQYAYETLAIAMFVWALAFTLEATDPRHAEHRGRRLGYEALAVVTGAAVVVTHHLSGLLLAAMYALFVAAVIYRRLRHRPSTLPAESGVARRGADATTVRIAVVTAAMALGWVWLATKGHPSHVYRYLTEQPLSGLKQMFQLRRGESARQLFRRSTLPSWMRLLAYAAPVIVGLLALKSLLVRRARPAHPLYGAFVATSAVYAFTLPLVLTRDGSEAAHRLFPFAWIGVSVLVGASMGALHREAWLRSPRRGRQQQIVALVVVAVVAVGNLAGSANDAYIFPGEHVAGTDTRSYDAELQALVDWFATQDPQQRIAADIWTGAPLSATARDERAQILTAAFPGRAALWSVFESRGIDQVLFDYLRDYDYGWLIVDRRMATAQPFNGYWFTHEEPKANSADLRVPSAAITKFRGYPWATLAFATDNYDVYRLDFSRSTTPGGTR